MQMRSGAISKQLSYGRYFTTLPSPRTYIRACISVHLSIRFVLITSDLMHILCPKVKAVSTRDSQQKARRIQKLTRANEAPRYTKPNISLKSSSSFVIPYLDKNFTADFFTSYIAGYSHKERQKCVSSPLKQKTTVAESHSPPY